MTSLDATSTTLISQEPPGRSFGQEQMAAASFLARCNGRTLQAYRDDLRGFFQWAHDHDIEVMSATRPHIELFRVSMEQRGLAAATIDRRLSTVRLLEIRAHRRDHHVQPSPVRPTTAGPSDEARGLDRSEFGVFLFTAERFDRDHAAHAVLLGLIGLRVTEACETNVEDLGFERGHRTLKILGKGRKPPPSRSFHERHAPSISPSVSGVKARSCDDARPTPRPTHPHRWIKAIGRRAGLGHVYPHMLCSAFIMAALDAGVRLGDVQIAARHADPRTTTIYDRRRQNFDRHAAYVVVAFVASC